MSPVGPFFPNGQWRSHALALALALACVVLEIAGCLVLGVGVGAVVGTTYYHVPRHRNGPDETAVLRVITHRTSQAVVNTTRARVRCAIDHLLGEERTNRRRCNAHYSLLGDAGYRSAGVKGALGAGKNENIEKKLWAAVLNIDYSAGCAVWSSSRALSLSLWSLYSDALSSYARGQERDCPPRCSQEQELSCDDFTCIYALHSRYISALSSLER